MNLLLQIWAGSFYLLNKIFLAIGERNQRSTWRIAGWSVYLVGLPAWIIIFVIKHNWIAASLELGGAPAMLYGLLTALHPTRHSGILKITATSAVYIFLVVGIGYSLYDYGGVTSDSQLLELLIVVGYLIGTYLLARRKWTGWLWFLLMNGSCALLMNQQEKHILVIQQCVSIGFVLFGLYYSYKRNKKSAS